VPVSSVHDCTSTTLANPEALDYCANGPIRLAMTAISASRSPRTSSRVLTLGLLWLLLGAAAFWCVPAHAVEPVNVRVHFHRDKNDYAGWGLHVWGAGLVLPHSISWDRPLEPTGVDPYGVYFDVGVEPTVQTFNMIVHHGETKSTARDMAVDIASQGREVWVRDGSDTVADTLPQVAEAYGPGLNAERHQRETLWWILGSVIGGATLLVLGWRVVGGRLSSTREQLAANVQLLVQARNDLRAQGERLQGLVTDELTGLPTRGGLQQALEQALARASRSSSVVGVMFIDLDGFKQVNDSGGHDAGDEVLRVVARRLRAAVRECDFVARVGGDEFVVVVECVASPMQAFLVGRKLVRSVSEEIAFNGQAWRVGASVGIALSPGDGSDAATLLKSADTAMYETKRSGKGACRFVQAGRQAELERQLELEKSLRQSLASEELSLALEPVVEFATGRIAGRHATIAWTVDGQTMPVPPVVASSDDLDLAHHVDRWLLTHACRTAVREPATGGAPGFVSMTLPGAAADLEDLPALVRDVLAEEGLPPQRLLLKFPGRRLSDPQRSLDVLLRLRGQGVRIGFTGITETDIGLQRLVLAPVDQLELDAGSSTATQRGTPYVRALAALGRQCGYAVVAVGVATPAQRRWAEAAWCTLGAGLACDEAVAASVA
jgi:diguanylate cyclase (GGDEF)-like protein